MTAEPERAPPSGTGDAMAHAAEFLARLAADPNAPADLWAEPLQSTSLADIAEVARLAREYSTPFGEEAR